jgi:hypothetical protein
VTEPAKVVTIGFVLSDKLESELISFLCENRDIFAWPPKDIPDVPRELAEHSLHVPPDAKPIKQPLRRFAEEKRKAIGEEIARLLTAGFIMEVFYPHWLVNLILVLKKNNTWCMCIDYTSLNKACLKDPFMLPCIDQVIDSTAGCDLLSFLDAYLGYHQMPLYEPDQIRTSFIIWGLQLEKHGRNLPALHATMSAREDRQKCACVC